MIVTICGNILFLYQIEFLFAQVNQSHTDSENKPLRTFAATRGKVMSELVWKSEYNIGHFPTDNEHKELISLANKVIRFSDTGEDIHKIRAALKALLQYTVIHFRNEEKYMERLGYPKIAHHKKCHVELTARLNDVMAENSDVNDLVHRLKRLMVVWVIEHIINEDIKIADAR